MFETLVTGLLTSALGSYIEPKCFSSDKINVAVWSGYVVLTELEVKPEVVADLPAVRLVRGLVGSIELKIPWNRLQSDSVVATVDDVYLLLRTEEDIDAVMRQMDEFTLKKKLLEELYAQAKRQEEKTAAADGADAAAAAGEDGFAARLINKIIDNLELHIRRIHIRIEDHSSGDHPFAMGLTIESVHVQSTNSNWQPSYVDTTKNNEPRIFKIVELNHLSVYCNPDCELQRDRQIDFETCSAEEFSSAFSRAIPKRFDDRHYHHMQLYPSQQQHHFLLKPIDTSARLIVNRDVFDANVPKFEVDVNVSEVAFRLEESQYCDMLYLASALQIPDHYTKYQRYRKFRPQASVFDDPAEWWRYAITAVLKDQQAKKQQWTWGFMQDRREDRKRYVGLWQLKSRQLLELADVDYVYSDSDDNDDAGENTDDDEQVKKTGQPPLDHARLQEMSSFEIDAGLEEIERRRSVEDVLFFRYLADLEVRKFQATRASRVRRRLPTPPTHKSQAFSDTESVDTEFTESSVPAEVRYRSWGAWMFGWTSKLAAPSPDGESGQAPHRIIPEVELRELFKILEEPSRRTKKRMHNKHRDAGGQDDVSDSESQMELSELYRVTVTLQRGSVTLASDPETNKTLLRDDPSYGRKYAPTDFLLGTFSQLQVAAVARDETVVVDVSLQSIEAFDESAESSAFSRLLSRKQTIRPAGDGDDVNVSKLSGVVFLMSYEMNPANSSADASLFVHMEPLEIVFSPTARCWGRLAKFVDTPTSLGLWEELEVASFNDIVNLKARTEAKLDYVMENRVALAVDLRIQAPVIIVPESDTDYNCARLVVDLGRINFRTDRLSQMDSDHMSMSSTGGPPSSRSAPGSLALLSPSHFRGVNSNTSFVQQLYDEAERGEGAIRWKEEFYDKFSLSITNIHVLLIPYGKTSRVQDDGTGSNGMSYPSVSLPPYLTDIYDEEQEYELVERFNINVTVRTSILPLDATLTRFYVHADLPALTFNLSLEKYFQLLALADRFSLANAEAPKKTRKYSGGAFYSADDEYGNAMNMPDSDDGYEAMRRGSFLSTSALKRFMLNDNESVGPPSANGVLADDAGDSDENASVESDDTWFSITSGNLDQSASSLSDDVSSELERNLSLSDISDSVAKEGGMNVSVPPRSERRTRKRPRPYTPGGSTKLLDRRLMVCSFTVPVISVQLRKPRSAAVSSYASYRYDTSDFDDDPADNGTILVKLQGFRIRVGQKTLSTQVNVSLMSLEVQDFLDASGRSTQYLLFSCPTITAPFSIKSPVRRGGKFPGYTAQRRRPNRQRERVISFQASGAKNNDGSRSGVSTSPETLLELGFSSLKDQKSGKEVLRDVDLQLGSVQFNFDQSYVCSLLELFEESSSQLALVPVSSRNEMVGGDSMITDIDDGLPPPFELTPTIKQEYSMPVSLTESVRADLERARKNLFEHAPDTLKEPVADGGNDALPVALKLCVRLHSVSVCFSDRGESVVSVAILHSQVKVGTAKAGQIDVSGLVGDVKVFDLSLKKREEDGLGISGAARGFESPAEYMEIFGLDASFDSSTEDTRHVLRVDCSISTNPSVTASEDTAQERQSKSRLSVSVQPVRFLAQPEFVENLANYVVDGPLRTHFLSKRVALSDAGMIKERKRADSVLSDFQLAPRFSPSVKHPPESLTPFFDAVDTSNREARQLNFEEPSFPTPTTSDVEAANAKEIQQDQGNDSAKEDDVALVVAQILDNVDLDVELFHPCVVLPSTPLKDIRVSLQSQPYRGIVLDFGIISIKLRREIPEASPDAPLCTPYQATVVVENLQITSLADQTAILDPSGFEIRCSIPTQEMNSDGRKSDGALPEIALNVEIYPVCLNVSETNVCLALEVFYRAIIPMFDTAQGVVHQLDRYEGASVVGSASLVPEEGGDLETASPAAKGDKRKWGQLTLHFLLEEFKIALISYSEAPQQFESWMKSVIDIPDEISSRESSGGASSAAQGRSYPQHFMGRRGSFPSELPCCVIGEIDLVALEANLAMSLMGTPLVGSDAQLQCEFSLQEAIVRDKIADPTEFLTHLIGPVPGALLERMDSRTSISSDSSSISFLSRDDILPPLIRRSTSHSSRLDASSSQLSGRLTSTRGVGAEFDSTATVNSLDVSVSSARFILLPRTLLRLEHFVLDVFLAASKKRSELEIQRDEALVNNPPVVESTAYADAGVDLDDNRGERQESRFTVPPLRPRTDSISESLKDDLNAVRSAFMSPLQRMLSSASAKDTRPPGSFTSRVIAEETGSGTSVASKTKSLGSAAEADSNKWRLPIPQWKIDAHFSNLQMWVISSDRKADVAGCVLSSQLTVKFDSVLDRADMSASDSNEVVAASVRLSKVEVLVGSPKTADIDSSKSEPQPKPPHHTGTLVENFEVDVQFGLRHCFRPAIAETIDPKSSDEKSDDNSDMNAGSGDSEVENGDGDAKPGPWINTFPVDKTDNATVNLPELFLRDVPPEWQEWILSEPTVRVNQIVSHIAYRDLPLLLKIAASLTSMLSAEKKIRDAFTARLKAAADDLDWADLPDAPGDYSEYAHYFGAEDVGDNEVSGNNEPLAAQYDVLTRASLIASGIQFRLINNIVDQASPVLEFDSKAIDVLLRAESNSMVEVTACCRAEAKYQNLRLVTMEPLIEPWSVKVTLSQQRSHGRGLDDREQLAMSPWKLDVSSDVFLQLNLTDALIANLVAADRAWRWVVNAGGDSREMTEYSTYWIRNNTGMPLRYWGASYNEHSLAPGQEEPLRFNKMQSDSDNRDKKEKRRKGGRRSTYVHDRQLFIAVEEEYPSDSLSNIPRKWQSEAPIPVDQVDSRMYALVDFEADVTATRMRKCECVIDVLVERGCKYFVVRSTLNLENQTSSDLEVEFVPPQRRSMSRSLRSGNAPQGHVIPIWKKIVKASSVVPVPVHIVSSGEGYVLVRPPEINGADSGDGSSVPPKAYAKERVHLPLFDRGSSSANENIAHMETDESGQSQCTIKFRRLYSDRPVRPFMMNVCLSSASSALYHRTLSFHPPLIVHNLTAGPLDFCLATPSDWSPAVEAVTLTNAGMNAGWETREQRLRERGTINVADSLIWHLSSEETPLELSVRMKGFDWSEALELVEDLGDIVRIKMKDLVSDAHLYITAEIRMSKGHCRELFLYVPYWIVNLTGLKLEYEYEEERMGREHATTLLAGQKRLDRDELLLKESQRAKVSRRDRNPHLLHPALIEDHEFVDGAEDMMQTNTSRSASPDRRENERKRRHPRLLPSVPPVKGLLDLLPKTIEYDPRSLGQLEVLQACHSDYRLDRGCVRLRVSNERDVAALDARKENGQRKWSDPFVLDQAGTIGEIEADDYGANRKFSIGYSIIPAKGQYSRTKVIMLTPRFMLINTMSSAIEVCHSSSKMMTPSVIDMANTAGSMPNSRVMSPVNPVVQLDAGAFADFHWTLRFAKTRTIRCRFAEYGWSWSGAVPLLESGEYAVRMRHESTRESKLVRVTLKLDSSCVCVYFREERTTAPPYRVENYSLETLRTHQHRVRRSEILLPHHSLDYAWDEPTEERLLVVDMLPSAAGDNSRPLRIGSFDLDKIQQYPDALGGTLGIEISTDGPTRVLRFTDTRLRGEKVAPANSQVANDIAAKTEAAESNSALQLLQRFVSAPTVHAALHLQGVGISIVDSAPRELVYMSISGIALELLVSEDDRNKSAGSIAGSAASLSRLERETRPRIIACCLEVNDVQVDNQLQVTPYPVLLRFSNPNGRSRIVNGQTVNIPVLQVGLVKHDEYAGIEFIRHFSVSVLPVHIRVDGALLYQILPLLVHAKIYGSSGNSATTTKKRAVVLVNGDISSDDASRAAHSHLLLKDFNASLEVPVKVLEAAQKDGTTSAGPTSGPTTPRMKTISRRSSGQQQLRSPRHQHTALAAEIQRYTATKYGTLGAIGVKDEQKKLYFEEFHIDPIRATVSFSFGDSAGAILDGNLSSLSHAAALTDPSSSSRDSSVITVGPLRLILNAIGTSLTKIANAPFQLKAIHIHNSFVQPDALATRLASHYQSEALRQAYVILGSVDVLGNPMIAWKNLRSGFQDFISEPAHGLSQRSPQAFAFGVGRGSLSLVRASVYTFLDFNTRILTAFSLGLSEACLKLDDYTGYPATRHIFQGLVQGVSGVVVAPIHSFEVNGARGVLPGIVAGAFGVVLKPLLGFSLATATTAATLRDAVDPNTKALLVRVRPPRHIDLRTKRLKVYSYVESLGEEIVGKIRGGRYRADGYLGHVDLKATHQCFLVTRKRILFLSVKGLASAQTTKYEVEWELLAEEVVMVDCSRTPREQIVTIYYMEDEFRAASGAGHSARVANGSNAVATNRRRIPGVPRGMFLQKHEVALPDTKVLFVRAMLQQQERSLLTKMNSYTKDGTPHHVSPVSSLARTNSMDPSTTWQPQHPYMPAEYPIFRLPPSLHQTRSFANLTPHHYNHQQHHNSNES